MAGPGCPSFQGILSARLLPCFAVHDALSRIRSTHDSSRTQAGVVPVRLRSQDVFPLKAATEIERPLAPRAVLSRDLQPWIVADSARARLSPGPSSPRRRIHLLLSFIPQRPVDKPASCFAWHRSAMCGMTGMRSTRHSSGLPVLRVDSLRREIWREKKLTIVYLQTRPLLLPLSIFFG